MTDFKAPPVPPQTYNENQNVAAPSEEPVVQAPPAPKEAPVVDSVQTKPAETSEPSASKQASSQPSALQENLKKLKEKMNVVFQKFNALPQPKRNLIVYFVVFFIGLLMG